MMDKTSAFIESMSEQETFDYVVGKLREQGRMSEEKPSD